MGISRVVGTTQGVVSYGAIYLRRLLHPGFSLTTTTTTTTTPRLLRNKPRAKPQAGGYIEYYVSSVIISILSYLSSRLPAPLERETRKPEPVHLPVWVCQKLDGPLVTPRISGGSQPLRRYLRVRISTCLLFPAGADASKPPLVVQ